MSKAVSPRCPVNAPGSESAPANKDAGALPLAILGLDLRLLCGECSAKLVIDARWQGRELHCPSCGKAAVVPHYSELLRPTDSSRKAVSSPRPAPAPSRLSEAEIAFLSEPGNIVPRQGEPSGPGLDGAPAPEFQLGPFVRAVLPEERSDVQGDDARRVTALASRDE